MLTHADQFLSSGCVPELDECINNVEILIPKCFGKEEYEDHNLYSGCGTSECCSSLYTVCRDQYGFHYVRQGSLSVPDCGIFEVQENNCFTLCNTFPNKTVILPPGSINNFKLIAGATATPNPGQSRVVISLKIQQTGSYNLSVLDLKAQRLLRYQQTAQKASQLDFPVNTASLPDGTYLYQIESSDGKAVAVGTFVIVH